MHVTQRPRSFRPHFRSGTLGLAMLAALRGLAGDEGRPAAGAGESRDDGISWSIPGDGGTPRDVSRIERVGPTEFRIRASFEEGGRSFLQHAVSRVELVCRND